MVIKDLCSEDTQLRHSGQLKGLKIVVIKDVLKVKGCVKGAPSFCLPSSIEQVHCEVRY